MSTNVFSGARAIFKIDGTQVAYASGVDGSEEIMYEPVDCLDSLAPMEYAPVGYRVTLTCAIFRTVQPAAFSTTRGPNRPKEGSLGSLKGMGIFPKYGTDGIDILTSGYMSATVADRVTQKTLYTYEEVKAQTVNFNVTARGVVGQNVTFNAIRLRSEDES